MSFNVNSCQVIPQQLWDHRVKGGGVVDMISERSEQTAAPEKVVSMCVVCKTI